MAGNLLNATFPPEVLQANLGQTDPNDLAILPGSNRAPQGCHERALEDGQA
jgi:hypothetical protein